MHKTTKNYTKQAAPRHWRLTGFYTGFSTGLKIKPVPPSSDKVSASRYDNLVTILLLTLVNKPPGTCVKSKIINKEQEFFSKYLLSTLGLMAYYRQNWDNYPYISLFTQNSWDLWTLPDIW